MIKKNTKIKLLKLMTGTLWLVNENEDCTEPISLKEFKNNICLEEPPANLSRGNIIPRNEKVEQHLIFDCFWENNLTSSFKLFLYDDGKVRGMKCRPTLHSLSSHTACPDSSGSQPSDQSLPKSAILRHFIRSIK